MVNQIKFQALNSKCIKCKKCSLSLTRNNVVFGRGNPNSKLFVVGEGPGQQEVSGYKNHLWNLIS